jgi:hypothetical protein
LSIFFNFANLKNIQKLSLFGGDLVLVTDYYAHNEQRRALVDLVRSRAASAGQRSVRVAPRALLFLSFDLELSFTPFVDCSLLTACILSILNGR